MIAFSFKIFSILRNSILHNVDLFIYKRGHKIMKHLKSLV